jgi:hypothetical protein
LKELTVMTMRRRTPQAMLVAAILSTAAGCDRGRAANPEPSAPPSVFVGNVTGTDVRVAVVATPHRARIYFCGGDSSYTTATKWLVADIDASQHLTVNASDKAWRLDAQIGRGTIDGTVELGDSAPRAFQAASVAKGTIAGLYETTASCSEAMPGKIGLIVAQSSAAETPVGQGACIGDNSATILQVNPIFTREGSIAVTTIGTPDPAVVQPATPPAE